MMKFLISNPSYLTKENYKKQKFANGKLILPPEVTNEVVLTEVPLSPAEQISEDICKCLLVIHVTEKQMNDEMAVPTYGNQKTYIPKSLSPYNDLQFVSTSKDDASLNSDESSKSQNNQMPPVKQKSNPVLLTSRQETKSKQGTPKSNKKAKGKSRNSSEKKRKKNLKQTKQRGTIQHPLVKKNLKKFSR